MHNPRLPKVGEFVRGVGTLVSVEEPQPTPPPPKRYIFETLSGRVEIRLGAEVLQTRSEWNDFYGKDSGLKSALEEAKKYAQENGISADSDIEVVVLLVVERRWFVVVPRRENFYNKEFCAFDSPGHSGMPDDPEPKDVWSSKRGDLT